MKQALDGRTDILMSAVNFGEVYGVILREHGRERAVTVMSALQSLPIPIDGCHDADSLLRRGVKSKYRLYYVDSFAAALAIEHKATRVTSDSDFRKLGHGFPTVWLKT